jgi:hypothetical protein
MKPVLVALTIIASLFLAACDPQDQVLVQKYHIVDVPASMYNCPIVKTYPAVATLTDSQVAKLLVQLRSNNLTCKASLEGIKRFLDDAKRTVH